MVRTTRVITYDVSFLCSDAFFTFDIFQTRTPLVLQCLVKGLFVDILAPPLAPAGKEDLLGISRKVVPSECPQNALSACILSALAIVKPEPNLHTHFVDETYLLGRSSHQACPWSASRNRGGQSLSAGSGQGKQRRRGTRAAGGATSGLPAAARTCSRGKYSGLRLRSRPRGSCRVRLVFSISFRLCRCRNEDSEARTRIRDASDRARRDDDHARFGLYQLLAEEMCQVMLSCKDRQHLPLYSQQVGLWSGIKGSHRGG